MELLKEIYSLKLFTPFSEIVYSRINCTGVLVVFKYNTFSRMSLMTSGSIIFKSIILSNDIYFDTQILVMASVHAFHVRLLFALEKKMRLSLV